MIPRSHKNTKRLTHQIKSSMPFNGLIVIPFDKKELISTPQSSKMGSSVGKVINLEDYNPHLVIYNFILRTVIFLKLCLCKYMYKFSIYNLVLIKSF